MPYRPTNERLKELNQPYTVKLLIRERKKTGWTFELRWWDGTSTHRQALNTQNFQIAQKGREFWQEKLIDSKIDKSLLHHQTTISNFSEYYQDHFRKQQYSLKYISTTRWMLSNLISRIGDLPLPKITKNHIQEFVAFELNRGRKPGGVSDDLRTFRAAFNWAIEEKLMVTNPVVGIMFPRVPRRLPRRLSPLEFTNLLKVIDREGDKKIALTLILTGMRINELLSLTWSNVKVERSYIFIKGKGGNEREIPIGSYLKEILLTLPRYEESELVFPGMLLRGRTLTPKGKISYTRIRARFSVYFAKAGIEGYGAFHRLRHSFASIIADSGHTSLDLKQLLGHASTSTTEIYTWVGGTRLRSTIEALDDGVKEMIEQSRS